MSPEWRGNIAAKRVRCEAQTRRHTQCKRTARWRVWLHGLPSRLACGQHTKGRGVGQPYGWWKVWN